MGYNHQAHARALPDEFRLPFSEDLKGIMAVDKDGNLAGACLFNSWSHNSCQIHIYIGSPFILKHGFQQEVFNYVFNTCGMGAVVGVTPADNSKALKFIKNIGLKELCRIPEGHDKGVDSVITCLTKADCRWIYRLNGSGAIKHG
jgi:RimJ/RimL family protein N-acetyltransferase